MSKESLIIIKPSPELEQLKSEVEEEFKSIQMGVFLLGEVVLCPSQVERIYKDYTQADWFAEFADYMISDKVAVYIISGEDAVEKTILTRDLIRQKHPHDRKRNIVHAPKTAHQYEDNLEVFKKIFSERS